MFKNTTKKNNPDVRNYFDQVDFSTKISCKQWHCYRNVIVSFLGRTNPIQLWFKHVNWLSVLKHDKVSIKRTDISVFKFIVKLNEKSVFWSMFGCYYLHYSLCSMRISKKLTLFFSLWMVLTLPQTGESILWFFFFNWIGYLY